MVGQANGQLRHNVNVALETLARELDPRHDMNHFSFRDNLKDHTLDILKYVTLSTKHLVRGGIAGAAFGGIIASTTDVSTSEGLEYMRNGAALGAMADLSQYTARVLYNKFWQIYRLIG